MARRFQLYPLRYKSVISIQKGLAKWKEEGEGMKIKQAGLEQVTTEDNTQY